MAKLLAQWLCDWLLRCVSRVRFPHETNIYTAYRWLFRSLAVCDENDESLRNLYAAAESHPKPSLVLTKVGSQKSFASVALRLLRDMSTFISSSLWKGHFYFLLTVQSQSSFDLNFWNIIWIALSSSNDFRNCFIHIWFFLQPSAVDRTKFK